MNDVIEVLKHIAASECYYDDETEDVCVEDHACGNVDDAFSIGENAGEVMQARQILSMLGKTW